METILSLRVGRQTMSMVAMKARCLMALKISKLLLNEAKVAVSPGVGFGEYGEGYVRFGLIENEHRTRQAIRGIKRVLRAGLPAEGAAA